MKSAANPEKNPKSRRKLYVALSLSALLAAVLLDSNLRLSVSRYVISNSRLPHNFEGYTIVQLSDLHGARFGRGNITLARQALAQNPDMIALTGDLISRADDLPAVRELLFALRELAPDLPIYFVSGNHDWAKRQIEPLLDLLAEYGVVCLQNEYVVLTRNSESIVLAGVDDPNGWADMKTPAQLTDELRRQYPETYTVLLGHRNYWAEKFPALRVDLILSGHGHGGVVRLPGIGGVFGVNGEWFPEYAAGVYRSGQYSMVVSRGLGWALAPRFMNNPEIVTVTLKNN